jgi:hypothetical protein
MNNVFPKFILGNIQNKLSRFFTEICFLGFLGREWLFLKHTHLVYYFGRLEEKPTLLPVVSKCLTKLPFHTTFVIEIKYLQTYYLIPYYKIQKFHLNHGHIIINLIVQKVALKNHYKVFKSFKAQYLSQWSVMSYQNY